MKLAATGPTLPDVAPRADRLVRQAPVAPRMVHWVSAMAHDPYTLPPGLPVPVDDGGADHLTGAPSSRTLTLDSSHGPVDLAELPRRLVLYVYPRTGTPGVAAARRLGRRSRAHAAARRSRARFATTRPSSPSSAPRSPGSRRRRSPSRSSSPSATHMPFPVIADPALSSSRDALGLPTFEIAGPTAVQAARARRRRRLGSRRCSTRCSRPTGAHRTWSTGCGLPWPNEPRSPSPRLLDARARLPHPPGLGVGRARRVVVRRDDEPARRGTRALLDEQVPFSTLELVHEARATRRDGEGALPHARRPPGRGGADALPRRPPLGVRLVAVGLPAHVHVLRDRPDALPAQPDAWEILDQALHFRRHRADRPRRLHGHGRADAEPRRGARRRAPAPRRRRHAPAHDDLDRRLAPGPDALRRRGRGADPPRALAARADSTRCAAS